LVLFDKFIEWLKQWKGPAACSPPLHLRALSLLPRHESRRWSAPRLRRPLLSSCPRDPSCRSSLRAQLLFKSVVSPSPNPLTHARSHTPVASSRRLLPSARSMNPRRRCVELRTSAATVDADVLQKGADFLKAFMLGFDVPDALALLRLDDLFVESFDVTDVKLVRWLAVSEVGLFVCACVCACVRACVRVCVEFKLAVLAGCLARSHARSLAGSARASAAAGHRCEPPSASVRSALTALPSYTAPLPASLPSHATRLRPSAPVRLRPPARAAARRPPRARGRPRRRQGRQDQVRDRERDAHAHRARGSGARALAVAACRSVGQVSQSSQSHQSVSRQSVSQVSQTNQSSGHSLRDRALERALRSLSPPLTRTHALACCCRRSSHLLARSPP
jgi:hypothetical protein